MDTYSCKKLDVDVAEKVINGVCAGCIQANCALLGGETAEMPRMFSDDTVYDIVGSATGAIERGKTILPDTCSMQVGDALLGLASSGCHSNGFSLVHLIIERAGLRLHDRAPWGNGESVGESLLTPTRIYVKPCLAVVKKSLVKGMAHITGGGLIENVPRMLPKHLAAEMNANSWHVPPVLRWLKDEGRMEDQEFAKTFNAGLGMVMVVGKESVEPAVQELEDAGETVYIAGTVQERKEEGCILHQTEDWDRNKHRNSFEP